MQTEQESSIEISIVALKAGIALRMGDSLDDVEKVIRRALEKAKPIIHSKGNLHYGGLVLALTDDKIVSIDTINNRYNLCGTCIGVGSTLHEKDKKLYMLPCPHCSGRSYTLADSLDKPTLVC